MLEENFNPADLTSHVKPEKEHSKGPGMKFHKGESYIIGSLTVSGRKPGQRWSIDKRKCPRLVISGAELHNHGIKKWSDFFPNYYKVIDTIPDGCEVAIALPDRDNAENFEVLHTETFISGNYPRPYEEEVEDEEEGSFDSLNDPSSFNNSPFTNPSDSNQTIQVLKEQIKKLENRINELNDKRDAVIDENAGLRQELMDERMENQRLQVRIEALNKVEADHAIATDKMTRALADIDRRREEAEALNDAPIMDIAREFLPSVQPVLAALGQMGAAFISKKWGGASPGIAQVQQVQQVQPNEQQPLTDFTDETDVFAQTGGENG